MARRVSDDELRLWVAEALHDVNRPDLLEDSPLVTHFDIRGSGFWAKGKALRVLLLEAGASVSRGLDGVPGMEEKKCLLDDVMAGKSISAWAKEHGKRRDGVSRRMWKDVSEWVSEELEQRVLTSSPSLR